MAKAARVKASRAGGMVALQVVRNEAQCAGFTFVDKAAYKQNIID
jgi:hypothetical protein